MSTFTLIPTWEIQDLIVFVAAIITAIFIIRKEEHPESVLLEMLCFCFLYAAVYENFATLMGWYGYGRTLFRVGNVPIAVPVVEYLVVYSTLRMLNYTKMPAWSKPFIVGFMGMLFDFSLDPLATKLVYAVKEGTIGRWSWFPGPNDVQIFGEPVYNFTGWVMICGYAAATLLLGRWWHRKSGYNRAVGILYPALGMLLALGILVSPQTRLFLWLEPFFFKGSAGEWIMLEVWAAVPVFLLLAVWRGRMREGMSVRDNAPVFLVLVGLPLVNLLFTVIHGVFEVLWLEAVCATVQICLVLSVYLSGKRKVLKAAP
jgi:hypothetical protein